MSNVRHLTQPLVGGDLGSRGSSPDGLSGFGSTLGLALLILTMKQTARPPRRPWMTARSMAAR